MGGQYSPRIMWLLNENFSAGHRLLPYEVPEASKTTQALAIALIG